MSGVKGAHYDKVFIDEAQDLYPPACTPAAEQERDEATQRQWDTYAVAYRPPMPSKRTRVLRVWRAITGWLKR